MDSTYLNHNLNHNQPQIQIKMLAKIWWNWLSVCTKINNFVSVLGTTAICTHCYVPAVSSREVGNVPATGLIFKDYLKVNAFEDPKVQGVELYLSDFSRPLTERLSKDFFSDPSTSSLACVQVGPILLSDSIKNDAEGEEVFEESRNLFFKVI